MDMCNDGVRMRNAVGRRECSWTPVCWCANAKRGWEARELMSAFIVFVRMANGIGKRESSWTRVTMGCACRMGLGSERAHGCVYCSSTHAEWDWEGRELTDACMLACTCGMGLGRESAHGRLYVRVRIPKRIGKLLFHTVAHPQRYLCFVMEKKECPMSFPECRRCFPCKAKHLRHSSLDMRLFIIEKKLPSLFSSTP
jgi:hypothetical protein